MDHASAIVVSTGTENFAAGILMLENDTLILPLSKQIPELLQKLSVLLVAGEMIVIFREIDLAKRKGYVILQPATNSESPACDVCGSITVKTGQVYRCLNCGNKMGI